MPVSPVQSFADSRGSIAGPSSGFAIEPDLPKEVAATNGRPTTIVIRKDGSRFNVTGPTRFLGGYPIFASEERDGTFGKWRWSGQRLQARVDRLGMFPLFYSEIPRGIALSTSISELIKAGASAEIDWAALQVLFRAGFCVGCHTSVSRDKGASGGRGADVGPETPGSEGMLSRDKIQPSFA